MRTMSPPSDDPSTVAVRMFVLAVALAVAACATPPTNPNPERTATRLAQTYGPVCEGRGPVNSQAWGLCVSQSYDRAVARHGGSCSDWQLRAASYEDCVMNASIRARGLVVSQVPGPYCIALNTGGDVNFGACK
jgi:hypothetical protein